MKLVGGELGVKSSNCDIYFTDSGRSSLRLFIRSGNKDKKFLIPNYFCGVIEDVLIQEEVEYDFYNVFEDLKIDARSVSDKEFDVFYFINYFGVFSNISGLDVKEKIVIEDNVFFYDFENINDLKFWFSFNSFRKTTSMADGSLVKTNLIINEHLIKNKEAMFSLIKYEAKKLKYEFIKKKIGDESRYLSLFDESELLINDQRDIFKMSKSSTAKLVEYDKSYHYKISKKYYLFLKKEFGDVCLNISANFYSFFVIKVRDRDSLRKYLFKRSIYLPIHWPESSQNHALYRSVISIPIFADYSLNDIKYVVRSIKEFYEEY